MVSNPKFLEHAGKILAEDERLKRLLAQGKLTQDRYVQERGKLFERLNRMRAVNLKLIDKELAQIEREIDDLNSQKTAGVVSDEDHERLVTQLNTRTGDLEPERQLIELFEDEEYEARDDQGGDGDQEDGSREPAVDRLFRAVDGLHCLPVRNDLGHAQKSRAHAQPGGLCRPGVDLEADLVAVGEEVDRAPARREAVGFAHQEHRPAGVAGQGCHSRLFRAEDGHGDGRFRAGVRTD